MRRIALCHLVLASEFSPAQTHVSPALDNDNIFTGTDQFTIGAQVGPVLFGALPAESNGTLIYCSNCQQTYPCAPMGTGAMVAGINGVWSCLAGNVTGVTSVSGTPNQITATSGPNPVLSI